MREFLFHFLVIVIISTSYSDGASNYQQAGEILNWMVHNDTPLSPQELHDSLEKVDPESNAILLLNQFLIEQKILPDEATSIFKIEEKLFELGVFDLLRKEIYPIPGLENINLSLDTKKSTHGSSENLKTLHSWLLKITNGTLETTNLNRLYLPVLDDLLKRLEIILVKNPEQKYEKIQSLLIHLNRTIFASFIHQKPLVPEKIQYHANHSNNQRPIDWYLMRALNRLRFNHKPQLKAHLYQFDHKTILDMIIKISEEIGPDKIQIMLEDSYISDEKYRSSYRKTFEQLQKANIEVRTDTYLNHSGSGQSHNKFILINGQWVWTGSTNITPRGFRKNYNHSLEFFSPDLNKAYCAEFEQMWVGRFQSKKWDGPMPSQLKIDDTKIEVFFSPQHFADRKIKKILLEAKSSILVGMFFLTNSNLLEILSFQKERGINVHIMVDDLSLGARLSGYGNKKVKLRDFLISRKIPFRSDGSNDLFHHKFALIDCDLPENSMVITGSMNWTAGAITKNDENILIIHDHNLASKFLKNFVKYYGQNPLNSTLKNQVNIIPKPKIKVLKRLGEDLMISIDTADIGLSISFSGSSYKDLNWEGGQRFFKIRDFFKTSRDGSILLEHPQLGILDAFLFSRRNIQPAKRVLKEWRMLSILGEWEECGNNAPNRNCVYDLTDPGYDFCTERKTDLNRVVDWYNCGGGL